MHAARARHDMFFISHSCKPACVCKIDDVKPTVQSSHVCTTRVHDACVHVMNAHTKFGLHMHENCKPLYKHVYVLRCKLPHDTRHKSC